jgi:hypothetical protein
VVWGNAEEKVQIVNAFAKVRYGGGAGGAGGGGWCSEDEETEKLRSGHGNACKFFL